MSETKIDKIKAWGADTEAALNRFMGDEELYVECLDMIAGDAHFDALAEAIAGKRYEEAFEHAHCLKGVCGNLGLTPLFDAMCVLVEKLRKENYDHIEDPYRAMCEKQEEFLQLVK